MAAFIVEHWEKRRAAMEGKATVETMSRDMAAPLRTAKRFALCTSFMDEWPGLYALY